MKRSLLVVSSTLALSVVTGALWLLQPAEAGRGLAAVKSVRVGGKETTEVTIKGRTAFRLLSNSGSLSPAERADVVVGRLNRLQDDKSLKASDIEVETFAGAVSIVARDSTLITVTEADARAEGKTVRQVADAWRDGIADALDGRDERDSGDRRGDDKDRNSKDKDKDSRDRDLDRDYTPDLKKKIVPIITFGSSLNVGAAQVQGEERDVDRCKAVVQLETDYKDKARIKILVPVQSEKVISHIDRVPGVSVSAMADYAIKE